MVYPKGIISLDFEREIMYICRSSSTFDLWTRYWRFKIYIYSLNLFLKSWGLFAWRNLLVQLCYSMIVKPVR